MKEAFIKLDGQDIPQKMFYDPQQKANINKTGRHANDSKTQ